MLTRAANTLLRIGIKRERIRHKTVATQTQLSDKHDKITT